MGPDVLQVTSWYTDLQGQGPTSSLDQHETNPLYTCVYEVPTTQKFEVRGKNNLIS